MERTRKNVFIDFFKGIFEAFNSLVNDGVVDYDAPLPEALKKPLEAEARYLAEQNKAQSTRRRNKAVDAFIQQTETKTPRAKEATPNPKVIGPNDLSKEIFEDEELDK